MDSLIEAADNFQSTSVEEIKQELFTEFMNKMPIWDYYGVSREYYLALSDAEKRDLIRLDFFFLL